MPYYNLLPGLGSVPNSILSRTPSPVLKVKRLSPTAVMPTKGTDGAACWDLYASESTYLRQDRLVTLVSTGLAFEVPTGYVGLVCSRSGMAAKQRMFVVNAPGVIDEDFRGEIKVILGMLPSELAWPSLNPTVIEQGSRIAQFMLLRVPTVQLEEVTELTDTARGAGGFGSTGT